MNDLNMTSGTDVALIKDEQGIRQAAEIALAAHERLRVERPWLPARSLADFSPRLEWMATEGSLYGLTRARRLVAFLGWFTLDDFRNLGPGALTPDWSFGIAPACRRENVSRFMAPLVRRLLTDVCAAGLRVHAIGVPASSPELLDELSLLGWGRIVLDAARPARELLAHESRHDIDASIRCAVSEDAVALSLLDAQLAKHIADPPVLMPHAHGLDAGEWSAWLGDADSVTLIAERAGELIGFIKAAPPQMDVSWFVQGNETLAICGMWVNPEFRGQGVASALVDALATTALEVGRTLISVDCETHNPEARAFWLSRFVPVSWSFERRF